jgi:transcriptional regulator with XRE-family HTH domain
VKKMAKFKFPNIEAERIRANLTQEEFAKELGIERKSYYTWLVHGDIPTPILLQMSKIFDCSIDYLLGRTRNPFLVQ